MGTKYEIPLLSEAQSFGIQLAGVTYSMNLVWNIIASVWVLDIYDVNLNPILRGIPLVTGVDLLAQYPDKKFGGTLTATTDHTPSAPPSYANLGSTGHVYFTTTP